MHRSISIIVSILLHACLNRNNKEQEREVSRNACYEYASGRDTILLSLEFLNDSVTGNLIYSIQEKDRNTGTIQGRFRDDILLADYTFMSEGVQSVRQVAFKKLNEDLIEGFGEVVVDSSGARFKDTSQLNFNQNIVLKKSTCE